MRTCNAKLEGPQGKLQVHKGAHEPALGNFQRCAWSTGEETSARGFLFAAITVPGTTFKKGRILYKAGVATPGMRTHYILMKKVQVENRYPKAAHQAVSKHFAPLSPTRIMAHSVRKEAE